MKRKLALMLAVVMSISMLPMNVFAKSDNSLTTTYQSLDSGTLLYDRNLSLSTTGEEALTGDDVDVAVKGTNLIIDFGTAITTPAAFSLTLSNANFFFREGSGYGKSVASDVTVAQTAIDAYWGATQGEKIVPDGSTAYDNEGFKETLNNSSITYNDTKGTWFLTANAPYRGVFYAPGDGVTTSAYAMGVNEDEDVAEIMLLDEIVKDSKIVIPMVILTDEEDAPVTVTVREEYQSGVTTNTYTISLGATGATTAKFADTATGRDSVALKKLTITETRTRTMAEKTEFTFRLDAPTGYKFTALPTTVNVFNLGAASVAAADVTYSSDNQRRIDIKVNSATKSSTLLGRIEIEGLVIEPLNDNTWGDITGLKVSDVKDSGISTFTFTSVIGKRADYGVTIVAADEKKEVPELYTGIFDEVAATAGIFNDVTTAPEDYYQLLEVKIKENSAASWWTSGRNTKLTLPEGVIVRGVEITDVSNSKATKGNKYQFVYNSKGSVGLSGNTGDGGSDKITFDKNEITIKDVNNATGTKTTALSLKVWVSISNRMAGNDITMELSGGGISGDGLPEPLVVAKAVAPVTVETKVSTVTIGRNSQDVADIVITENGPGALAEKYEVELSMGDQYALTAATGSRELRFVNAKVETTEGDIDVTQTIKGETITLKIDSESTEASTITVSNVRINAATTLPSSEKEAYKLLVAGNAIVNNFDSGAKDVDRKAGIFDDTLKDSCIMVDYIRTGATAGTDGFDPTTPFEITTDAEKGEMYYTVDGEKFGITADKYPKNVNGVVLLSVRLVAEAFGREVGWDPIKGVATITLSTFPAETVQFTVGSPYYVKNGVEQLMLYDDGVTLATADVYEYEGIGRLFVPMRWLGRAMGVATDEIQLDGDSGIAYFNRP